MALRAVEHVFSGTTTPYTAYDSTKTTLGKWIVQNTGVNNIDKWAGPCPVSVFPVSDLILIVQATGGMNIGDGKHALFLPDVSTAAATTRRIYLIIFNTSTLSWSYAGFITMTYPVGTHTLKTVRGDRYLHTTGTVSSSGTTVTGSGSDWSTARIAAGARIGFGSTDPTQITTWYYISSIASDTSLTLSTTPPVAISAGSSYVIEELRVYTLSTSSAPITNGGLFVAKGINFDDFTTGGTTIAAATTTDNIKAVYQLTSANLTVGADLIIKPASSNTSQTAYGVNQSNTSNVNIVTFNLREALTVSSGTTASATVNNCVVTNSLTGTVMSRPGARLATTSHGPGSGVSSLYFLTSSLVYRIPESSLSSATITAPTDSMSEVPKGGTTSFATYGFSNICYVEPLDKFLLSCASGCNINYLTQYNNSGSQFERNFLCGALSQNQITSNKKLPANLSLTFGINDFEVVDGMGYMCRSLNNSPWNQIYAFPLGMDWSYSGTDDYERLITPKLTTTNCVKFIKACVNCERYIGDEKWAIPNEPYKLYYRTSGIDDNSGSWTALDDSKDLTSISAANNIQFMFKFKILGTFCIPSKIYNITVMYEDNTTDSHYQPSISHSNIASKIFAWRFSKQFNTTVPDLTIKLYNAESGSLLLTDTASSPSSGTWQKSTNDGVSWSDYDTTDKSNEITYIRYTPNALTDDIKVKALLTR